MKIQKINRNPNKWKPLAIIFSILSVGAIGETARIFTSPAADIANQRTELSIMATIITGIFLFLAIWFWRKSEATKRM